MGAEARYVLRSGRWSSQGVSQSGEALRASPSLVELSGRLPVWWSSQGVSQSGGALRASPVWWSSQGALQPPVPPGARVNAVLTQLPDFFWPTQV